MPAGVPVLSVNLYVYSGTRLKGSFRFLSLDQSSYKLNLRNMTKNQVVNGNRILLPVQKGPICHTCVDRQFIGSDQEVKEKTW